MKSDWQIAWEEHAQLVKELSTKGEGMTCVICQSDLEEEIQEIYMGVNSIAYKRTGYHICPKCRIVYKEKV